MYMYYVCMYIYIYTYIYDILHMNIYIYVFIYICIYTHGYSIDRAVICYMVVTPFQSSSPADPQPIQQKILDLNQWFEPEMILSINGGTLKWLVIEKILLKWMI